MQLSVAVVKRAGLGGTYDMAFIVWSVSSLRG